MPQDAVANGVREGVVDEGGRTAGLPSQHASRPGSEPVVTRGGENDGEEMRVGRRKEDRC